MRLGTAIECLVDNYKYASDKEWINDKVAWALYHTWKEADRKTEPTTEDCSTVDKDINVRSKDEPQAERIKTHDYCDICNHKRCGDCIANNLDDYCVPSGYEPITKTETQNLNLIIEKADERCKGCNHYKLTCDLFSEICRFEPKDEPQTDGILFKGNLKEGDYKLIKTSNGWVLEGNDIAYCGEPQTERSE